MPNVRETQKIKIGQSVAATDLEVIIMYLVAGIRSEGTIKTSGSTHPLGILFEAVLTVWTKQINRNGTYSVTGANDPTEELLFMNLGRMMKQLLTADAKLRAVKNFKTEILRNYNGSPICTGTGKATLIQALTLLYFMVGTGRVDLFGSVKTTEYMSYDDTFAGMFAVLRYFTIWWNLHYISYFDRLRRQGEIAVEGGSMKGQFKPIIDSDPSTWDAALVEENNNGFAGTGVNLFGVTAEYLDEPLIKGMKTVLCEGSEQLAQRVLSPSQWVWRYERWIKVIPIFNIWMGNEAAVGDNDGGYSTECIDSAMECYPLADKTNIQWVSVNQKLIELVAEIQGHYFKEKAFANCKAWFKIVSVWELPVINDGKGGSNLFQCTTYEHKDATRDHIYHKFAKDTADTGHLALMLRRNSAEDKRFLMMGDMELRDYLLHIGLNVTKLYIDGAAVTDVIANKSMFSPYNALVFPIIKDEDRPERITLTIKTVTKQTAADLNGKSTNLVLWDDADDFVYGTTEYNYPVSLLWNKTVFYKGRSADPFKKLEHDVPDVNALDCDYVMEEMHQTFFGKGGSAKEEIPVSAVVDDKKTTDNEKTNITEVSAIPDEVQEKIEEKKQEDEIEVSAVKDDESKLAKMQKEISQLKKKIADGKKKEAKKDK